MIYYMGLEPYESRYTLQLQEWNTQRFDELGIDYTVVHGDLPEFASEQIVHGDVLDAHTRAVYSMSQISNLIHLLRAGKISNQDTVFFEDMFTPGIESLPYIFDQTPAHYRPRVFVRCLAQTIDPDDFVHRTGMFNWMRRFEQMVDEFVDGILCASEEMVAHLRIAGIKSDAYVTGLPFGKSEVFERCTNSNKNKIGTDKPTQNIVFAARFASEKQPHFFMDVIESLVKDSNYDQVTFTVCSGSSFKSDDSSAEKRMLYLKEKYPSRVLIEENLSKEDYYNILADSPIIFNCALQDWVSNTVSEGDTLGSIAIYPAYRSFPEVFKRCPNHLYIPWSVDSAVSKIKEVFDQEFDDSKVGTVSNYQDKTINRTLEVFENLQQSLSYRGSLEKQNGYRKHAR